MNKPFWSIVLGFALIGSLTSCAKRQVFPTEAFHPVQPDASAYSKRIDTFFVVLDTVSSMDSSYWKRREADRAREIISRMNRMIPGLDYRAGLLAFSSGSCLSCEDAVALYGPAPYNRDEFAAALSGFVTTGRASRFSSMGGSTPASRAILQGNPGRVALIVVSDSENILHGRAFKSVQKLKGAFGDSMCLYPIQVDRDSDGRRVMDELVNVGGCGFSVHADDIDSPTAMADYVTQVFLTPAEIPLPAVSAATTSEVDSDGDGVPNSRDKCPNTPKGVKANTDGCWELRGVFFESDKAVIQDARVLDEAVAILKANPNISGELHGHTDSTASTDYNQKLSEARANAVRDYFVKHGIAPERIRAKGYGESRPAASNDTPEGRALNRRVELHPDRL